MFGKIYDILGESLNVLSDRQNIIASNIANANTPGYKAKTINFEDVMRSMVSPAPLLPMKTNSAKDLSSGNIYDAMPNGSGLIKSFVRNQTDESIPPLDGNTVDLSKEMTDMASNAIRFEAVANLITKKFNILNYTITQTNP
ncbi:MAG: flagellar basal body rod protein FlgB [Deltaproteobacteria bacterium]|nr:flagellar basal body rod protein FlgB [Deltaproteobacteria bacterium]